MTNNERWKKSYPNPLTAPLRDFSSRLINLNYSGPGLIPDLIVALVLSIVILLLSVFWIYGVIVNIQRRLWDYVKGSKNEMEGKSIVEKVPYTITVGIFFIVWIPFVVICAPYYLFGLIGRILST